MPQTPRLRCFVALDLPAALRDDALRAQDQLRQLNLFQGRFTAPENIHLTLKFLGELPTAQATETATRLQTITAPPFTVKLGAAGLFAPRIIWLQLIGADPLQK